MPSELWNCHSQEALPTTGDGTCDNVTFRLGSEHQHIEQVRGFFNIYIKR